MNVVMLDGESENETAKNKRDNIVHVRLGHVIRGSDSEEREEKERRHGGDGHGHGLRDPPGEDPSQHPQHVPAAGTRWTIQLHAQAYHRAQKRSQQNECVFGCEYGYQ